MSRRFVARRAVNRPAGVACGNCRHRAHAATRNPLLRAYEHFRPPSTCQAWVDRTTWWDGELCRCPDPVHRH